MCRIDAPGDMYIPDIEQLSGESNEDFEKRFWATPDPDNRYDTETTVKWMAEHNAKYDDVCPEIKAD